MRLKILFPLLILSVILLVGCQQSVEKTGAVYSCCDLGCYSSVPCDEWIQNNECPSDYHWEDFLGNCVKDDGSSSVGQVCFPDNSGCGTSLISWKEECNEKIFADRVGFFLGEVCDKIPSYEFACDSEQSSYYCTNAIWRSNELVDGQIQGDLFCDILDIRFCESGCFEGVCDDPVADCLEGEMRCGVSEVYDAGDDPYLCDGGKWVKDDTCSVGEFCEERLFDDAWCSPNWQYCLNNNVECIRCSPNLDNLVKYDSFEECESNIVYYCTDVEHTYCRPRSGGCLDDELSILTSNGINFSKQICESDLCGKEGNVCCGDSCDSGLSCAFDTSVTDIDGNFLKTCQVGASGCDVECAGDAWVKAGGRVIVPNYSCIVACEVNQKLLFIKLAFSFLIGLITLVFSIPLLRKRLSKKSDKNLVWFLAVLVSAIMGALFFYYFVVWVIVFILYLLLSFFIPLKKLKR